MSLKVRVMSLLKEHAPFVIEQGRAVKKYFRKKELEKKKSDNKIITRGALVVDLRKAGISEGDNIIVHSSLSKMGYVEGGAACVVDALLEAVGSQGNVMMPCYAHHTFSKFYLDSNPVFDVLNSPSMAGAITEELRKRKGTLRSFHPTDAACVYGPLAEYFTSTHFGEISPYTENSPYYKLALKQGKILCIGVPLNTSCTNMHTLEDAVSDFKFPVYHSKIYNVKMVNEHGKMVTMKTKVHDPAMSEKRRPNELVALFEKEGILKHCKIGEADTMVIDAAGLFEVMIRNYKERGVSMYTPHGSENN